jgi:hypothetical protein
MSMDATLQAAENAMIFAFPEGAQVFSPAKKQQIQGALAPGLPFSVVDVLFSKTLPSGIPQ